MSRYTVYESSPDVMQNDGTALVNTETKINSGTVKDGGNVGSNGPTDAIARVTIHDPTYNSDTVGGVNNAALPASPVAAITNGSVANATGKWAGSMLVTHTSHGKSVGTTVSLSDSGNVYTGAYRIVAIVSANTYVVNGKYTSSVGSVTVSYGSDKSATDSTTKPIGNLVAGQYAARVIGLSTYNGITTKNTLGSPASEYGRRKIHSRTAVRSHGVEAAIRAGYWDIYSGTFSTAPTVANDFSAMGADEEVANSSSGQGVKGEFSYRYGITVTQKDY